MSRFPDADWRVDHIGVRYPDQQYPALEGIQFSWSPGEWVGIVGGSGAGKSTLARALLGLVPIHTGAVWWGDHPWVGGGVQTRVAQRGAMQAVFQDPAASLDPRRRVAQLIADPIRDAGLRMDKAQRAEKIQEAMAAVGLSETYAHRYPGTLSGGECQRVAIARALVTDPAVIVCDEILSALDVSIQAHVINVLQAMHRTHSVSLILISHQLQAVRLLCDQVVVLYGGRMVEKGAVEDVFQAPRHPYTRLLLDTLPVPDPTIQRRKTEGYRLKTEAAMIPSTGCGWRIGCERATARCAEAVPAWQACEPDPALFRDPSPLESENPAIHQVACHHPYKISDGRGVVSSQSAGHHKEDR